MDKKLTAASKSLGDVEKSKSDLHEKLTALSLAQNIEHDRLQQSASESNSEIQTLRKEQDTLMSENAVNIYQNYFNSLLICGDILDIKFKN